MRKIWAWPVLAMLLSGCSRGPTGAGASHQRQATPHRASGAVRFDLASDPANLNPLFLHQDAASVEQQVARLAFEPFVDFDPAGREIPELLLRVPSQENGDLSRDGRTIVYRLRSQVTWSDGVPVTSDDVLYTCLLYTSVLHDPAARAEYVPLQHVAGSKASFEIYDLSLIHI